ncbi:hypothetical protein DDZ18_04700 [Marinicauda salina]|uniref:Uncharacterized protein n=1 Tax=Marinicauda salina TaxID=2135793 RepID=A0A2U2BXZ4_9PROT|nr:DUF5694 domain-containing protein [Marinicauda salina]PWE18893.1 hypothetical protein DDZ18_04700 [Marinicauda salina]
MLTVFAAFALQAAEPAVDFSGVQEPLGGEPTDVLVLGTSHLNQLPEDAFEPGHLALVLDRLEAFSPNVIAIEAVGGRTCDRIDRYPHLHGDVYDRYCWDPEPALEALGMTRPEADAAAFEMLAAWPETPEASDRRRLAALLYGAGEAWSAALQWRRLDPAERVAGDGVSDALAEELDELLTSRNENNLLGVELGARLGLETLAAVDDHSADAVYARAPESLEPVIRSVWNNPPAEAVEVRERAETYLGSAESVLAGYRYLNSPAYQEAVIASDFGNAAAAPDADAVARQYVAWWQTRGLRMAANVIEAAANDPGADVLVITGSSHKPYFDAYLDQMHDIALVDVDAVLHD